MRGSISWYVWSVMDAEAWPYGGLCLLYWQEEAYVTAERAKEQNLHIKQLSGTKLRQMLRGGEDIPDWFAFKSVVEVLRQHT